MSFFTRYLQKIGEVLTAQKKVRSWFCFWIARADWIYSVLKILSLKIYVLEGCLRGLSAKRYTQIYLRLLVLEKCLKRVFQVSLKRFPVGRDSLEVKKFIKIKFLWITAATAGRFYEWVSVFLEKRPRDVFAVPWVRLRSQSNSTVALFIFVKTMAISFVI